MTYKETIIDAQTGEKTERLFTSEEIAILEARKAEIEAEIAERNAEKQEKDTARQAVLAKLGLTAEEVAALFA